MELVPILVFLEVATDRLDDTDLLEEMLPFLEVSLIGRPAETDLEEEAFPLLGIGDVSRAAAAFLLALEFFFMVALVVTLLSLLFAALLAPGLGDRLLLFLVG